MIFLAKHVRAVAVALGVSILVAACGPKVDPAQLSAGPAGVPAGDAGTPAAELVPTEAAAGAAPGEGAGFAGPAVTDAAGSSTRAPAGSQRAASTGSGGAPAPAAPSVSSGPVAGVTATEIRIGMHLPQSISGLDISSLVPLDEAVKAYWDSRNREGGINGRQVKVFLGDDKYSPSGAVEACKTLVERNDVFAIFGAAGADQIAACGQYTLGKGRPYLSAGTAENGLLGNPNYWALTQTYEPMSRQLAEYAVAELDGRNRPMAMLRMNTPNANSARRGFVTRARELGAKVVVDDAVDKDPNPSQLQAECIKMKQEGVEIVYLMGSGLVMAQAADACASQGYRPQWLGVANTAACGVEAPLGSESLDGCITFSANHHPLDTEAALEAQAKKDWAATYPGEAFPDDDPLLILVWAISDVLREALQRSGPDLTVDTFNATMGSLVYDNGIMNPLDFRDGSHVGGQGVVLWKGDADAGRLVEIDGTWRRRFDAAA